MIIRDFFKEPWKKYTHPKLSTGSVHLAAWSDKHMLYKVNTQSLIPWGFDSFFVLLFFWEMDGPDDNAWEEKSACTQINLRKKTNWIKRWKGVKQ